MKRKQNFQTISWFWDLYTRDKLDLEPPYQRRSVWNREFKDYFVKQSKIVLSRMVGRLHMINLV